MSLIKTYYQLTKPGIVYGNALTTIGGFLLASGSHVNLWLFLATLLGISCIIASACVFNNYIDRDIDEKMVRTKKRALVKGAVSGRDALVYATILGLLGTTLLVLFTNPLTILLALTGFFFYVVVYGYWKRHSVHGTVVGSISGAIPPIVGYCAVNGRMDTGAIILFLILVFWQMPHFYAIAMYRVKDYAAAGIPVLPVEKGMYATKVQIVAYTVAFVAATGMLTVFGYTGYTYLVVMAGLGLGWLWLGMQGFKAADDAAWARKMFLFSLVIILAFSIMMPVGALLP